MKRNIIIFGGIAGLVIGVFILLITRLDEIGLHHAGNEIVGYAAQVIAFSFIFVGVKNFRDKFNEGNISFGKAFKIGLGITLIGSTIYVLIWLVDFYVFIPDFMEKYAARMLKEVKDSGVSDAVKDKKVAEINSLKEMYKNPLMVILFTYAEIMPVGLIISLLTALILKRNHSLKEVREAVH
jgi:amino acid transporter